MLHFSLQMTLTRAYNRKLAIQVSCFVNNHLCKGARYILKRVLNSLKLRLTSDFQWLHSHLTRWTKPLNTSLGLGTVSDLFRSTSQLVAEHALLRQQLLILRRRSNDQDVARRIAKCWYCGQEPFRPGSKPCSLSSQRRSCVGIVRVSAYAGSARQR